MRWQSRVRRHAALHSQSERSVEDDANLRRTLATALRPWAVETRTAATLAEARRELAEFRPGLVVLDFALPDGTALELLKAAPLVTVVALSAFAAPVDSFELAKLGVRAYLQKPIELSAFDDAIRKALTEAPALEVSARQVVGHLGLKQAEEALRRTMLEEALERSGGNRPGAARLLKISRELLQHALKKLRE